MAASLDTGLGAAPNNEHQSEAPTALVSGFPSRELFDPAGPVRQGSGSDCTCTDQLRIEIDLTVPTGGYHVNINEVHRVGDELWVLSSLDAPPPGTIVTQAITSVGDAVTVDAPDLPIRHFVIGGTGSLGGNVHTNLSSADEFADLLVEQGESEQLYDAASYRSIAIELTVPSTGWNVNIEQVHRVGNELWVLSSLDPPNGFAGQVITNVSDEVTIDAPNLPVKHFVTGKTWNWGSEDHTNLASADEFADLLAKQRESEQLYDDAISYRPIGVDIETPTPRWSVNIDEVHKVGNELWVLSSMHARPGIYIQVISRASDQVTVEAPDLPIRHFVTGKTWNWGGGDHTYLSSSAEFADLLAQQGESEQLYGPENHELPKLSIDGTDAIRKEGSPPSGIVVQPMIYLPWRNGFEFTVTRTGNISETSTVDYTVTGSGSNPADADDFDGFFSGESEGILSGQIEFAAGEMFRRIYVPVTEDWEVEPDEGFTVTLSNAVGALICKASADGLIINDEVPTFSIEPDQWTKPEGDSGSTPFTFTVTRKGPTDVASEVDYTVSGRDNYWYSGSTYRLSYDYADANDFVGGEFPAGRLRFEIGETSKTITIDVAGEMTNESDEWFTVTLSNPSGSAVIDWSADSALSKIVNDDEPEVLPSVSIVATDAVREEGNTYEFKPAEPPPTDMVIPDGFVFTVTRSGDLSGASTVNYTVTGSGINPADRDDFLGQAWILSTAEILSGQIEFAPGEATKEINLPVVPDWDVEADEGFTVTLTSATGAVICNATAEGLIINDEVPVFAIRADDFSQQEGDSGATPYTFTVTREGVTDVAAEVDYLVAGSGYWTETVTDDGLIIGFFGGDHASADDFVGGEFASGRLRFEVGETFKTITINVAGDTVVEAKEGFKVTLSNPSGDAMIAPASETALAEILNDDAPGKSSLSISTVDTSKEEGETFEYIITRSGDTSGAASVRLMVDGHGANPADHDDFSLPRDRSIWANPIWPRVEFLPGETTKTVSLSTDDDGDVEPDEGFVAMLFDARGAVIDQGTVEGVIINDDEASNSSSLSIVAVDAIKQEGEYFEYVVNRTGDTSGTASVYYSVTGSGANPADQADFTPRVGRVGNWVQWKKLQFDPGETSKTIRFKALDDGKTEPDEGFTVTLSNPDGAVIDQATADGVIVNHDVPVLWISADQLTKNEGDAGETPFTFTVTRDQFTDVVTEVDYAVTGSGANPASASDFARGVLDSGRVRFEVGETSKTITVNVAGDTIRESNEEFTVRISNGSGNAQYATVTASSLIINDDDPSADSSLSIEATKGVQPEGESYEFTVTRSGDASGTAKVTYVVDGHGVNPADEADFGRRRPRGDGSDQGLFSGELEFAPGQRSRRISFWAIDDRVGEPDEGFTVTLVNPEGAVIGQATANGTIVNNDVPSLKIAADQATKNEGNSGQTPFTFTVTRKGITDVVTEVDYAVTGNGTNPATAADFAGGVLPSGKLRFEVGETSRTITVDVAGDTNVEANEDFTVTLSNASGTAQIETATAQSSIFDDDSTSTSSLSIEATKGVQPEGESYEFTVTRSGDTSGTAKVTYVVDGHGANPADNEDFVRRRRRGDGSDQGLFSGELEFAPGQQSRRISFWAIDDRVGEPDEGFTVTLVNPEGAVIGQATANGTIVNNDVPSLKIAADQATKNEGNSGQTPFTFTVTREGVTNVVTEVDYAVTGNGANPATAADFAGGVLPSGKVRFEVGETSRTITVDVAGDTNIESNEDFIVTLNNASGTAQIETATAQSTIFDDDSATAAGFSIAATEAVKEEGEKLVFTVTRSGDASGPASVDYVVTGSGSNPADADDFIRRFRGGGFGNGEDRMPFGTVDFGAGETTKTIELWTRSDKDAEPDEGFTVTLSNPEGAVIGQATAGGTIVNDDVPVLAIEAEQTIKNEGNSGQTPFTFTVTRKGITDVVTEVDYAVTGSGANLATAADFAGGVLPSGKVRFEVGETSRTITVDVAGDTNIESNEDFIVTLNNASGTAQIETATAQSTIFDDDSASASSLSITATEAVKEEGEKLVFTVTRSGDASGPASVDYVVTGSGSNPADADDFIRRFRGGGFGNGEDRMPFGTVEFRCRETTKTIELWTRSDKDAEPDEGFTVTLSNPEGAVIGQATAGGTIKGDLASIRVAPDGIQTFVPESVAQEHVIPGDEIRHAILFRAEADTMLTIVASDKTSGSAGVVLADGDLRPVDQAGGSEDATMKLRAGEKYALIFPARETEQKYLVQSSQGAEALSTDLETNFMMPSDVDMNGKATARDALLIINEVAKRRSENRAAARSSNSTWRYFDVNRDGRVSALDALRVVNFVAESRARANGEGQPSPQKSKTPSSASADRTESDIDSSIRQRRSVSDFSSPDAVRRADSVVDQDGRHTGVNHQANDELFGDDKLLDDVLKLF